MICRDRASRARTPLRVYRERLSGVRCLGPDIDCSGRQLYAEVS